MLNKGLYWRAPNIARSRLSRLSELSPTSAAMNRCSWTGASRKFGRATVWLAAWPPDQLTPMIDPRKKRSTLHPTEEAREWAITLWLIGIAGALAAFVAAILFQRYL
jgi:hypothetical protein